MKSASPIKFSALMMLILAPVGVALKQAAAAAGAQLQEAIAGLAREQRNAIIRRKIQAENRHIALFEDEIKNAHRGIADCKKRLMKLHNEIK